MKCGALCESDTGVSVLGREHAGWLRIRREEARRLVLRWHTCRVGSPNAYDRGAKTFMAPRLFITGI